MGTSPAVNDFHLLADHFRQLSDQVRNVEIDGAGQLPGDQIKNLEASAKALENAYLVMLGADIQATLDSIQNQIQDLKKVTKDARTAMGELETIAKRVKTAIALGSLALGFVAKDPEEIKNALTTLTQTLTASTDDAKPEDSDKDSDKDDDGSGDEDQ